MGGRKAVAMSRQAFVMGRKAVAMSTQAVAMGKVDF